MRFWMLFPLCLAACGADATGPQAAVGADYMDPAMDPLYGSQPLYPDQFADVRRVQASIVGDTLVVTITFADSIAPLLPATPRSVRVFLGIDSDRNSATGDQRTTTRGLDFKLNNATQTGMARVVAWDKEGISPYTPVAASYTWNGMTIRVPLTVIGNQDGRLRFVGEATSAAFGIGDMLDVFPNGEGFIEVSRGGRGT